MFTSDLRFKTIKKTMKNLLLIFAFLTVFISLHAQSDLIWTKNDTSATKINESSSHILSINEDTMSVVGKIEINNSEMLNIIKYDLNGNEISNKTYGDQNSDINVLKDYVIDSNDNIYILYLSLKIDSTKLLIQKYAANGNLLWNNEIKQNIDTFYNPRNISLINDTNIVFNTYKCYPESKTNKSLIYDAMLFSYNTSGNKLWERNISQLGIHTFKHKIFVYNNSTYFFYRDLYIIVDINNNIITGNNSNIYEFIQDMQLTPDSNLLLTARNTYTLHKVKPNGENIWKEEYMPGIPVDELDNVIQKSTQDSVGNIYVTGFFKHNNNGTEDDSSRFLLTIKYDSNGNAIWENKFAYPKTYFKTINSLVYKNGFLYLGGQVGNLNQESNNFELLKIDAANGNIVSNYNYNGEYSHYDAISDIKVFDDNKVVLTGISEYYAKYIWTTQMLSKVTSIEVIVNSKNHVSVYPNPILNGNKLTINGKGYTSYSIITIDGKLLQKDILNKNEVNTIKIGDLSTGVYLLQLQTKTETVSSKIVVY